MHERRFWRHFLVALTASAVLVSAVPALAYHKGDEKPTVDTAHTLRAGEVRISLWSLDVGILDSLQVNTVYLIDFLQVFNGGVKWRFWQDGPITLSTKLEFAYVDFENWPIKSTSPATALVVPFDVSGSWQISKNWSLHSTALYTQIEASATPDAESLEGAAGVDNLQAILTAHWRWGDVTTLYVRWRQLVFQEAGGAVDAQVTLDDKTTARIVAEGDTDAVDFGGATSTVFGAIWSGKYWNLRLGLGYGSWTLPVVNFVREEPAPILDFDLYFKF